MTEQQHAADRIDLRPYTALVYKLAIPILIIDQLSKIWIRQTMPLNTQRIFESVDPFFKLTHIGNTGSVFGILPGTRWVFTILALIVTIGLLWFNHNLKTPYTLPRIALGLVLGGAIGNLIDRILVGHVTDFLDFDLSSIIPLKIADWYIFNVADAAVVAGAILLAYLSLFAAHQIEEE